MTRLEPKDISSATDALKGWFKSQDLAPGDAVMVAEAFIALMIVSNMKSADDLEAKLNLVETSIRTMIFHFVKAAQ